MEIPRIPLGEWGEVATVSGDAGWVHRLAELGVREGCRLQVVQPGSPCVRRGGRSAGRGAEASSAVRS